MGEYRLVGAAKPHEHNPTILRMVKMCDAVWHYRSSEAEVRHWRCTGTRSAFLLNIEIPDRRRITIGAAQCWSVLGVISAERSAQDSTAMLKNYGSPENRL
jgi:hypothetical protein